MKSRCFKKQRLFFVLITNIRTDYSYYFKSSDGRTASLVPQNGNSKT